MDTDQLMAFERIVREGSFSRAARMLDITQPTISARIQALEQEVGGPLFVRGGRKITLTEGGERFLPYARRSLAVLAEGVEAAQLTHASMHGRITVGTMPSLAGGFLAASIAHFHNTHPKVEFFVRTGHSEQVVEMLYDGIVKLGLITWPFFNNDLAPLLYFREPLVLVVSAQHPLASKRTVTFEEVRKVHGHLLVVHWGPSASAFLSQVTAQAGPMVELPVETAHHMLLRGIGAAFLTRTVVADELAAGRIVELTVENLPPSFRESALVRLASNALSSAATDFVRVLCEEAGELCQPNIR